MKNMEKRGKACLCPYCEEEMVAALSPYCQTCGVYLLYCEKCQLPVKKEAKVCPHCGGTLTARAKA